MSRQELSMEVRLALAAHVTLQDQTVPVTQLCRERGISRQAYYEYRARFLADGIEGLLPRSRRPGNSPRATGAEMIAKLLDKHDALVRDGWDAGARSVHDWLVLEGEVGVPSWRTVHKYLADHGRTTPTPAKRPRSSFKRFRAKRPNGMWQIDGFDWHLADATKVVIVRTQDDHSRLVLASVVDDAEDGVSAWACLVKAMDRHGKPAIVLSDNGSAFSARRRRGGAYSDFEARLALIGVVCKTGRPRHPQTQGKKEREWGTLTRWLQARPPAATKEELLLMVEGYEAIFNSRRPHQSLQGNTPASVYQATAKDQPDPGEVTSRQFLHEVTASHKGYLDIARTRIQLGPAWAGAPLKYLVDLGNVVIFQDTQIIARVTLDRQAGLDQSHSTRVTARPHVLTPGPAQAASHRAPEPVKAVRQDTRRATALTGSKLVPPSKAGPGATV
jgi:transposase InsO family protein